MFNEDDELRRIREKKMRELMEKTLGGEKKMSEEAKTIDKPVHLRDGEFDSFLKKHKVALVDFYADWCMPCKMIAPVIENLAKKYAGKIVFGKVNIDESPSLAARFSVYAVPTLIIFREGEEAERVVGADLNLEQRLKKYL